MLKTLIQNRDFSSEESIKKFCYDILAPINSIIQERTILFKLFPIYTKNINQPTKYQDSFPSLNINKELKDSQHVDWDDMPKMELVWSFYKNGKEDKILEDLNKIIDSIVEWNDQLAESIIRCANKKFSLAKFNKDQDIEKGLGVCHCSKALTVEWSETKMKGKITFIQKLSPFLLYKDRAKSI